MCKMRFKNITSFILGIFFIFSVSANETYKLKIDDQHTVEFNALDQNGIKNLKNKRFQEVNELNNGGKYFLDETPEFLISLSSHFISNKDIDDIYIAGLEAGALGGKLLGAGGCGYLLLYASPLYQKQIKSTLGKKGAIHEMFKFSQNGLEVWSTKR